MNPETKKSPKFDLLEIELFRHTLLSIVEELETNLTRTAYSTLIYEYKDYSIGFVDADFVLVAQSKGSLPIFVADLGAPIKDAVEVIGFENLEPGDMFLTNYAPACGQHLNNVILVSPVFSKSRRILGYLSVRAHWADLGGIAVGSLSWNAESIFQEGVQYRGLRIQRGGKTVPEVMKTVEANTRMPKYVMGDLRAQIGACTLGLERWQSRVGERWDDEEVLGLFKQLYEGSATVTRNRIKELLSEGSYSASCFLDDAGREGTEPLKLEVRFTVKDGQIDVDLSGMPPQVAAPMNAGRGAAESAIRVGFKNLLVPDLPINEGHFDPISIFIPDGTIISATGDAPMSFWNASMASIIDLVLRAVGEKNPELVPAGHHASMNIIAMTGLDDGDRWLYVDTAHGGFGASANQDGGGPHKTLGHGDTRDIPLEITEMRFPLVCLSYKIAENSGGAGLHRGGDGTEKLLEVTADGIRAEFMLDRTFDPPWGMNGGAPGRPGEMRVKFPGEDDWLSCKKAGQLALPKGTLVYVRTAGGGGWGSPTSQ